MSELSEQMAPIIDGLTRHRWSVRHEKPEERARRQQIRAEEMARAFGRPTPGIVKAMLALVIADEVPNPKEDPPPPLAPGAKQVLKPQAPESKPEPQPRLAPKTIPAKNIPEQGELW